jgi:hypothetical protein
LFEEIFTRFYEKNKGIKVIGVWGKDGLELEKKYFSSIGEINKYMDLEFSGAELADILNRLDQTRAASRSFCIKLNYHNYFLVIYSLTRDYFLMILSGEDVIEARLKFYLDLYRDQFISAL